MQCNNERRYIFRRFSATRYYASRGEEANPIVPEPDRLMRALYLGQNPAPSPLGVPPEKWSSSTVKDRLSPESILYGQDKLLHFVPSSVHCFTPSSAPFAAVVVVGGGGTKDWTDGHFAGTDSPVCDGRRGIWLGARRTRTRPPEIVRDTMGAGLNCRFLGCKEGRITSVFDIISEGLVMKHRYEI